MNPYHQKYLKINSVDKKSPAFVCPLFPYVVLKKVVNDFQANLFDEFEYYLGKEYSTFLYALQEKKGATSIHNSKALFSEFENLGFGKTQVVSFKPERVILRNKGSSLAHQYKKSFFDQQRKPVDYFLAGVYSGIATSHFKKNIEIREETCSASGSIQCVFTSGAGPSNKYETSTLLRQALLKHRLKEYKGEDLPNEMTKKLFQRGNYSLKGGVLKIANIYHVFFRFGFFTLSNNVLSQINEQVRDIHKFLGYSQALTAIEFQKNHLGVRKKDDIFNWMVMMLNIFGYGDPVVDVKKEEEIVISFNKMFLLKQSLQFMDRFEDPYFEGILTAISRNHNKKMNEVTLSVKGDDKLVVKMSVSPEKTADEIGSVLSQPVKKLMKERMTHKYYLNPS